MSTLLFRLFTRSAAPLLLLLASGCVNRTPPPEPLTVPQVVEMSKAGTKPSEIMDRMRQSGTVYRLTASQLVELSGQGVAPEVLDYMQQTYILAVREDAAYSEWSRWTPYGGYWYGGAPYGWPDRVIIVRERVAPPPPPPPPPPRKKK